MAAVPNDDLDVIRRFCDGRVPAEHWDAVRVDTEVRGSSVTVVERRAPWHLDDSTWSRTPVARLRHDPAVDAWHLDRPDRDGRWLPYSRGRAQGLDEVLALLADDPTGIFWG